MNAVAPYDWRQFWEKRLKALDFPSLTGGLEASGYSYVYQDTMIPAEAEFIKASHMAELYHSIGLQALADGTLLDVWVGSPAFIAGLGPGDKLTEVNGKPYTGEALTAAVHDAGTTSGPILLTAMRDDETQTYRLDYHGGEKYAALVRNGNADLLTTQILQPR